MKKIYISRSSVWKTSSEIKNLTSVIKSKVNCKIFPFDDEAFFKKGEEWDNDVYSRISECDLFIAIVDKEKSSFFLYELGYAQGAGKKIILLSMESSNIPSMFKNHLYFKFDISKYDKIIHSISNELEESKSIKESNFSTIINNIYRDSNFIHHYSHKDFEIKIKNLFEHKGYSCEYNRNKLDIGYDLFIKDFSYNKNALIECKKFDTNKKVSIETVYQLLNELILNKIEIGIIITTSTFTNSAIEFAKKIEEKEILLWDLNKLKEETTLNKM